MAYAGLTTGMEHHVAVPQPLQATVQPAPAAVVAVNSQPPQGTPAAVSITVHPGGTTQTVVTTTLAHPSMQAPAITATPVTVGAPMQPQTTAVTVETPVNTVGADHQHHHHQHQHQHHQQQHHQQHQQHQQHHQQQQHQQQSDVNRPVRHYKSKTLPQGCKEVVKTRKSGATYKVWVDPSGREFRTLRALLTHVTGCWPPSTAPAYYMQKTPTPRAQPMVSAGMHMHESMSRVRSRAEAGMDDSEGLPSKPKRPRTAYAYFFAHANASVRAAQPEGETHGAWVAKETARRWKRLTDDDKKPFVAKADIDRERFNSESRIYKAALRKSEKNGGEFGIPLPKRPPNSYALFYKSVYEKVRADRSSGGREDVGSAAKTIGAMWKALPPADQGQFKEQAKAELQKFHERMKEYNAAIKKARQDREQQQQQQLALQQQQQQQLQAQQMQAQQLAAQAEHAGHMQAHAAAAVAAAAAADGDIARLPVKTSQVTSGVSISVAPQSMHAAHSAPGAAQINAGAVVAANAAQLRGVVPTVVSQQG